MDPDAPFIVASYKAEFADSPKNCMVTHTPARERVRYMKISQASKRENKRTGGHNTRAQSESSGRERRECDTYNMTSTGLAAANEACQIGRIKDCPYLLNQGRMRLKQVFKVILFLIRNRIEELPDWQLGRRLIPHQTIIHASLSANDCPISRPRKASPRAPQGKNSKLNASSDTPVPMTAHEGHEQDGACAQGREVNLLMKLLKIASRSPKYPFESPVCYPVSRSALALN